MRTSTTFPATATIRLMNTSSPKIDFRPTPSTGLKMMMSPVVGSLVNRYVIFSATNLSPISKVGNIESEGMKRGSPMNLQTVTLFQPKYQLDHPEHYSFSLYQIYVQSQSFPEKQYSISETKSLPAKQRVLTFNEIVNCFRMH